MVVSSALAQECMANYDSIMQGSDLAKIRAAYSSSVTFTTPGFATWLTSNGYLANTVDFKVCFGIYTANAARAINKPEYEGRLTVFIWPEKAAAQGSGTGGDASLSVEVATADDTDDPYNAGELKP